jgi:small subunit ribosomal protein S19
MRSKWKGFFVEDFLLNNNFNSLKKLNFKCRNSTVISSLVGKTIFVHNGKEFKKVFISRDKVGFKLGDFSLTRNYNYKQKLLKK